MQLEDVLATSAILEYPEESYENEEEWDTTDSSLFESASLEEEIQDQMNSNAEVKNISPSEENEIVHSMGERLEEKHESAKVIKELLWFSNDEHGDEALMQQEKQEIDRREKDTDMTLGEGNIEKNINGYRNNFWNSKWRVKYNDTIQLSRSKRINI